MGTRSTTTIVELTVGIVAGAPALPMRAGMPSLVAGTVSDRDDTPTLIYALDLGGCAKSEAEADAAVLIGAECAHGFFLVERAQPIGRREFENAVMGPRGQQAEQVAQVA